MNLGVDDDLVVVVVDLVDSDDEVDVVVGGVGDKNFSSSLSNSPFLKLLLPPPLLLPLPLLPRILFIKEPSFLVEEEEDDDEDTNRSSMLYDELNVPSLFFDNSDFDGEEVPLLLLLLLKMDDLTMFLMLNFDPPLLLTLPLVDDCLLFEAAVVAGPKSNCTRLLWCTRNNVISGS